MTSNDGADTTPTPSSLGPRGVEIGGHGVLRAVAVVRAPAAEVAAYSAGQHAGLHARAGRDIGEAVTSQLVCTAEEEIGVFNWMVGCCLLNGFILLSWLSNGEKKSPTFYPLE